MKLTLMIEGSAATLAAILASLPEGAAVALNPIMPELQPAPLAIAGTATGPVGSTVLPTSAPAFVGGSEDDAADAAPLNVNAPATDKAGYPWDARIHSENKAQNNDGTWRYRRGMQKDEAGKATIAAVEAELRAAQAVGAPVAAPVAAPIAQPVPVAIPVPQPVPVAAAPQAIAAPVAIPQPVPMPVEAAPVPVAMPVEQPAPIVQQAAIDTASGGAMDFATFMGHLQELFKRTDAAGAPLVHVEYLAGLVTRVNQACNSQMNAITDLVQYPQLVSYVAQVMAADGRW